MRFKRAAQRRFGLTPLAMDDTGAPVVKIRATWSPKNVYVIDNKALIRDDFVKLGIAQAPGKCSRALESGRRRTPPYEGGCCDFFFNIFPRKKRARVALPIDEHQHTERNLIWEQQGNPPDHPITTSCSVALTEAKPMSARKQRIKTPPP
jgi:hypothetical protein